MSNPVSIWARPDRHESQGRTRAAAAQTGAHAMRKIKSNFFISLDGVVESPDQWHFPYFDDEMGNAVGAGFATTDAILMGRVLYDEWAAYWPEHADEPFGDVMNSMKKYVISNSLKTADWQNSEVISGDVAGQLAAIKASDGGDITMSGSATTVRWLLRHGLVDELNLLVHPIIVGGGRARLFPPDEESLPLKLTNAEIFKSGVLNLTYSRSDD
jgi:dihydrofolate reductase